MNLLACVLLLAAAPGAHDAPFEAFAQPVVVPGDREHAQAGSRQQRRGLVERPDPPRARHQEDAALVGADPEARTSRRA